MFGYTDPMPCTPINEPVSVQLLLDAEHQHVRPFRLKWRGKVYVVKEVGKYHPGRQGIVKLHYFTVNVGALDMRICIDSSSLVATLQYISDGLPD